MEDMEVACAKDKRNIREIHSYACHANHGEECTSSTNTPIKQPSKKVNDEPTLSELQTTITTVIGKLNERADQTDKAVHYNTVQIEGLKKSLEYCHQEVVQLKRENVALKN